MFSSSLAAETGTEGLTDKPELPHMSVNGTPYILRSESVFRSYRIIAASCGLLRNPPDGRISADLDDFARTILKIGAATRHGRVLNTLPTEATPMSLRSTLSNIWNRFQGELFPELADEVAPLLEKHQRPYRSLTWSRSSVSSTRTAWRRTTSAEPPATGACLQLPRRSGHADDP